MLLLNGSVTKHVYLTFYVAAALIDLRFCFIFREYRYFTISRTVMFRCIFTSVKCIDLCKCENAIPTLGKKEIQKQNNWEWLEIPIAFPKRFYSSSLERVRVTKRNFKLLRLYLQQNEFPFRFCLLLRCIIHSYR